MSSNDDNAWMSVTKHPLRVVAYGVQQGRFACRSRHRRLHERICRSAPRKYFTLSTFTDVTNEYIGVRTGCPPIPKPKTSRTSNIEEGSFLYTHILWMNAAEVAFLKAEAALRAGTARHPMPGRGTRRGSGSRLSSGEAPGPTNT